VARIDLHAHTTASDGTLSPSDLVAEAVRAGLSAVAITDHDTLDAIAPASAAARRAEPPLRVIPGVELSAEHDDLEFHLLGLLIDPIAPELRRRLVAMRAEREDRAERIVERLRDLGHVLDLSTVRNQAAHGASLGRPHVARALMTIGLVSSVNEAFDKWLGEGCPAYIPKPRLAAPDAIELIHEAGGVAIMAHPFTVPEAAREAMVRDLARLGLDGLEVEYPRHSTADRARYQAWADELGLVATGGSDFHGANKPDIALGHGVDGNVHVQPSVLEALEARLASRRARQPA